MSRFKRSYTGLKRPLPDEDEELSSKVTVELPKDFRDRHTVEFGLACDHILRVDPTLLEIITKQDFPLFLRREQQPQTLAHHYAKLASAIISQQISGAAARSVKARLMKNFGSEFPTPLQMHEQLSNPAGREMIRACGLSGRKVTYLESLTEYFINNEEVIEKLFNSKGKDEEIVEQLTKNVKGIGRWTASMFLVSGLGSYDVFAVEDLGLARGCSNYLSDKPTLVAKLTASRIAVKKSKIKHKKMNWKIYDEDLIELCAERFAPYRTVLMFIFWRLASTNVEVLEKNETNFVSK
ncbi:hypothetical protein HG536_0D02240 [Torulaspora globosa]|uniref:HhH-GPD domain-containing protein n=1 Tax=Torulaspora globosa TaxID=48254 RepID=A0A7G3ZGR6_9SACH|nr:uncharacterized protein HG536_0D02240 [Torulaspora globosa]QLL32702.1 hypothetical protein HG536_0D02240 [Torulaspora globosa]